jgi:hypothetical protein
MIDRNGKVAANHTGYGDKSLEVPVAGINKVMRRGSRRRASSGFSNGYVSGGRPLSDPESRRYMSEEP